MGQRVESAIDRVTVFPGAAWVTRIARIVASARAKVALVGLPAALDDDTVQIAVRGPARAVDVRITLAVTAAGDGDVVDDSELHARRRAVAGAQAELGLLRRQLDGVAAYGAHPRVERDEPSPAWADALGARLALVELSGERERALRVAVATAERVVEEARQSLAAAELRRSQATSARLPPGSVRKTLEVTVEPDGVGGDIEVIASYLVPGAQWAPSYVVRLGDGDLRLELRASIAQATGEDWTGVAVEVSTASPQRWIELPELPSVRIGRAQPRPARAGWRPPPPDIDGLFTDWDRSFGARRGGGEAVAGTVTLEPTSIRDLEPDLERDEITMPYAFDDADGLVPSPPAERPRSAPQPAQAVGAPMALTMTRGRKGGGLLAGLGELMSGSGGAARAPVARAAAKSMSSLGEPGRGHGFDARGADESHPEAATIELSVRLELLVYTRLRMRGPRETGRGKLEQVGRAAMWSSDTRAALAVGEAIARARTAAALTPPSGLAAAAPGAYDYAFAADARLDVPADGTWHNVALLARPGQVAIHHVVVPAVAAEVYRVATFTNPLDAPLLAGPVDVYDRGELVVTAALDETAPGATIELGLGVDATVKAARNARFREEAAGMLRGALKLVHEVAISVENLGPRAVQLEVRERLPQPAADEEDVEVHVDRVTPSWESWKPDPEPGAAALKGGHRWRLEVPAEAKRELQLDYHVRIAGKHELIGGNRREP